MKLNEAKKEFEALMRGRVDPFDTEHLKQIMTENQQLDPGERLFYAVNDALILGYMVGLHDADSKNKRPGKTGFSD